MPFEDFQGQCALLPQLQTLRQHLTPDCSGPMQWMEDFYAQLEKLYLGEILRFKTNHVTAAEAIF